MDFCRDVPVSGGLPSEFPLEPVVSPAGSKLGNCSGLLEEVFPGENTESDFSLEWLSVFVEDCFSNTNHIPQTIPAPTHLQKTASKPLETHQKPSLQELVIPAKARTKRRRNTYSTESATAHLSSWSHVQQSHRKTHHYNPTSDPPLLHQTHWLADSELIVLKKEPKAEEEEEEEEEEDVAEEEEDEEGKTSKGSSGSSEGSLGQARRCTHCLSQRTPQWRAGPLGPKTLCNACGVRFKSGRLLPEYRPAKSPTFVSYKHSNSHKKVMEMRMAVGFSTVSSE